MVFGGIQRLVKRRGGKVQKRETNLPLSRLQSLLMNETPSCTSRHGCRASSRFKLPLPRSNTVGLMYGIGAARLEVASLWAQAKKSCETRGGMSIQRPWRGARAFESETRDKGDTYAVITSMCAMTWLRVSRTSQYEAEKQ